MSFLKSASVEKEAESPANQLKDETIKAGLTDHKEEARRRIYKVVLTRLSQSTVSFYRSRLRKLNRNPRVAGNEKAHQSSGTRKLKSNDHHLETCDICFKRVPVNGMPIHRRRHTLSRPYFCPTCKRFIPGYLAAKHVKSHPREEVEYQTLTLYSFKCRFCRLRFPSDQELSNHYNEFHPDQKPLECIFCGLVSPLYSSLENHIREHIGEQPE